MKPSAEVFVNSHVLELFKAYHAKHGAWGSLHIVLDDGNVKDSHVEFCVKYAKENGDDEGYALARLLMHFSPTQRLKIRRLA